MTMKSFFDRKHIWLILVYLICYLLAFRLLEMRDMEGIPIIHTALDERIPFCEYFIVPYLLWFFYIAAAVLFFACFQKNTKEYWQLILSLGIGMTLFLIVSWCFPNGHDLRPVSFERDNIFTEMVGALYRVDTPTNILPSIHVFNSVAAAVAVDRCQALQKHWLLRKASWLLAISIVLSTMFLKQHSVVDVASGLLLYTGVFIFVYGRRESQGSAAPYGGRLQGGIL